MKKKYNLLYYIQYICMQLYIKIYIFVTYWRKNSAILWLSLKFGLMLIRYILNYSQVRKEVIPVHRSADTEWHDIERWRLFVCLFVCLFVLHPFQQYFSYVGRKFPSHLSWKEPVLDAFSPCQTTKASPGDRTHAKEVSGLAVSDTNYSTTEEITYDESMTSYLRLAMNVRECWRMMPSYLRSAMNDRKCWRMMTSSSLRSAMNDRECWRMTTSSLSSYVITSYSEILCRSS